MDYLTENLPYEKNNQQNILPDRRIKTATPLVAFEEPGDGKFS